MTRPKLIASDMDGTLLNAAGEISPRTAQAIRDVVSEGIEFVLVTGRSRWSSRPMIEAAGLDDGTIRWALCSNGGTLMNVIENEVVEQSFVDASLLGPAVAGVRAAYPDIAFSWELLDGVVDGEQWSEIRRMGHDQLKMSTNRIVTDEPPIGPVVKAMVAHPVHTGHDWLDMMAALLPEGLIATTAGASFAEISSPAAEKGAALAALCARLGVESHEVAAFGDHANDLGMLAFAGQGYVMANGHTSALAVSDLRAEHHDDDGVAQVLEGWLQLGR